MYDALIMLEPVACLTNMLHMISMSRSYSATHRETYSSLSQVTKSDHRHTSHLSQSFLPALWGPCLVGPCSVIVIGQDSA
jgi:hypothetical protein